MPWLLLALLAPLFFSLTNFIEKYIVTKLSPGGSAGALTILAGLAGIPLLAVFGFIARHQLASYGTGNAIAAIGVGLMVILAFYFYYQALNLSDTSIVATLFQLIIPANYVFGLVFLNETLSGWQILAVGAIIAGAVALNLENIEGKLNFNTKVLLLMALSSVIIALSNVIFKVVATNTSYLPTQFYEYSAGVIAGLAVFTLSQKARGAFLSMVRSHTGASMGLSQLDELLNLSGLMAMRYAMILVPVTIVQAVMSIQAVYLVVIGAILTLLFPRFISENISRKHLLQKSLAVVTIVAGTAFLAIQ